MTVAVLGVTPAMTTPAHAQRWTYRGQEDTTAAFWRDPADSPDASAKAQMVEPMEQDWWARVRAASGVTGR